MSSRKGIVVLLLLVAAASVLSWRQAGATAYALPDLPGSALYGNLLINRTATAHGLKAVSFSPQIIRGFRMGAS